MAIITLPITEVRKDFLKIVKGAEESFERFIVTKNGKPEVVIMGYDEYEGWIETLEIMSNRQVVKNIKKADKEFKKGKTVGFKEVFGRAQKRHKK